MKNTNVRKRNWEWRLSTYERQKQNNLINNNPAEVLERENEPLQGDKDMEREVRNPKIEDTKHLSKPDRRK